VGWYVPFSLVLTVIVSGPDLEFRVTGSWGPAR
jgi:hypothetical protein